MSCHFAIGGLLAEIVLLGNIPKRRGKQLQWDGPNTRFTNDEEANRFIKEPYRSGWHL